MRASRLRHLRFESSKKDVHIFLPFLEYLLLFKSQSMAPVKFFGVGKGISGTFWMMAAGSWRAWVGRCCCYRLIQARSNGQRGAECGTLDPSCHLKAAQCGLSQVGTWISDDPPNQALH